MQTSQDSQVGASFIVINVTITITSVTSSIIIQNFKIAIKSPFYSAILLACLFAFPALSLLFIILPLLIPPLNLILNLTNAHAIALAEAN
jgi:hypothetical protein